MAPRGSTSGWRRLSCGGLASPRGLFRRITHRVPMCGLLWWTRGRGRRRTGLWRGRTNGYGRLTCMPVVFSRYIHSFVRCGPRRTYLLQCEKHKYLGARCSAYEMPRRSRRGVSRLHCFALAISVFLLFAILTIHLTLRGGNTGYVRIGDLVDVKDSQFHLPVSNRKDAV